MGSVVNEEKYLDKILTKGDLVTEIVSTIVSGSIAFDK